MTSREEIRKRKRSLLRNKNLLTKQKSFHGHRLNVQSLQILMQTLHLTATASTTFRFLHRLLSVLRIIRKAGELKSSTLRTMCSAHGPALAVCLRIYRGTENR